MKIINRLNKITKKREKRRNAKTNGSDGIFSFFERI